MHLALHDHWKEDEKKNHVPLLQRRCREDIRKDDLGAQVEKCRKKPSGTVTELTPVESSEEQIERTSPGHGPNSAWAGKRQDAPKALPGLRFHDSML